MAAVIGRRLSLAGLLALALPVAHVSTAPAAWEASWGTVMQGVYPTGITVGQQPLDQALADDQARDQTLRQIVRSTLGGSAVRIRLSNAFGSRPITFGSVTIALRTSGAGIAAAQRITFSGQASTTIAAGDSVVSDAVPFNVPAAADLAVSLHVVGDSGPITYHAAAWTTSYLTGPGAGDHTLDTGPAAFGATTTSWYWLDAVDVLASDPSNAVAVIGDSITDGFYTTVDGHDRWTDVLAARLRASDRVPTAVINAGTEGNQILGSCNECGPAALDRLDRDVFSRTGVTRLIIEEGTNDLNDFDPPFSTLSASQIIAGLTQLATAARAHGISPIGATILPRSRSYLWDSDKEQRRQDVNAFIRTSPVFDGVIDFDALMGEPGAPDTLRRSIDWGDGLHPTPPGYLTMGSAVDLTLLAGQRPVTPDPPDPPGPTPDPPGPTPDPPGPTPDPPSPNPPAPTPPTPDPVPPTPVPIPDPPVKQPDQPPAGGLQKGASAPKQSAPKLAISRIALTRRTLTLKVTRSTRVKVTIARSTSTRKAGRRARTVMRTVKTLHLKTVAGRSRRHRFARLPAGRYRVTVKERATVGTRTFRLR
jgi:lysophospholipase L1-like esterase